jgi:hypothetical protein
MLLVGRVPMSMPDGSVRPVGVPIPEAATWPRLGNWIRRGLVVDDAAVPLRRRALPESAREEGPAAVASAPVAASRDDEILQLSIRELCRLLASGEVDSDLDRIEALERKGVARKGALNAIAERRAITAG